MSSEYRDRFITCVDCDRPFTFTAGEQQFYKDKGFTNDPKRCTACREAKSKRIAEAQERAREPVSYDFNCAQCGKAATVNFVPTGKSPLLCARCYAASQEAQC